MTKLDTMILYLVHKCVYLKIDLFNKPFFAIITWRLTEKAY